MESSQGGIISGVKGVGKGVCVCGGVIRDQDKKKKYLGIWEGEKKRHDLSINITRRDPNSRHVGLCAGALLT